jgi:hypothetical protein
MAGIVAPQIWPSREVERGALVLHGLPFRFARCLLARIGQALSRRRDAILQGAIAGVGSIRSQFGEACPAAAAATDEVFDRSRPCEHDVVNPTLKGRSSDRD